ncbi:MAG: Hsp70 family protein [Polyangiaceae bacterium]|nr:Hsp70 family protein [Polyangiaceae bacterium]
MTILEILDGVVEIQASAGDARLGGCDFDEALAEFFAARAKADHRWDLKHDPRAWARLIDAAEDVKKRLSSAESTRLALVDLPLERGRKATFEMPIDRDQAEETWAPLIARLKQPIARALRDAGITPDKIDEVLLVGGSTRLPCVVKMATQLFGRLPLRKLPPDEAVALGAAVQAALKTGDAAVEDMVVTDVAPFTLGIAVASQLGSQRVSGVFSPIVERGTVIPVSRVVRYYTVEDHQTELLLEVYQGEHSRCADNRKLGDYLVKRIPRAPQNTQAIDVRFTYDLNGILEVEATIVSTGEIASFVIEKSPGHFTAAQMKAAREQMKRLKMHPRDALPNATAIARADALYVELSGGERALLGEAIAAFRAALESQDETQIKVFRERLSALTLRLKR